MQLHSDHMNHGFGGTGGCWGTQLVPSYPLHLRLSAWRASQEKQGPRIFILSLLSLIIVVVGGKLIIYDLSTNTITLRHQN